MNIKGNITVNWCCISLSNWQGINCSLLVLVSFKLTQPRMTWEERHSIEKGFHKIACRQARREILNYWLIWADSDHCMWCPSWVLEESRVRKAERKKPVSSLPSLLMHQLLPPGLCLEVQPWLPFLTGQELRIMSRNIPAPPHVHYGHGLS